jgi:hypothetical protein
LKILVKEGEIMVEKGAYKNGLKVDWTEIPCQK